MSIAPTLDYQRRLHPDIASRVVERFKLQFWDDAVLNAYKTVEERLRAITGSYDADAMELIKQAFHPNTGMLTDPRLWPSEKEGFHQLFRGAFLAYRNGPAHKFMFTTAEDAYDAILLANRLYVTTDSAYKNRLSLQSAQVSVYTPTYPRKDVATNNLLLDVDNDGQEEILVTTMGYSGLELEIIKISNNQVLDTIMTGGETLDVVMADVDNDGNKELTCVVGHTTGSDLTFYRLANNGFMPVRSIDLQTGNFTPVLFEDAQVVDFDGDGRLEVVSQPWRTVPEDLWPEGEPRGSYDTGRVQYVYRWNAARKAFDLLYRELLYIGGR